MLAVGMVCGHGSLHWSVGTLGSTDEQVCLLMCCLISFKIRAVQRVYPSEDKLHATDLSSGAKNVHSLLLPSQLYSVSFNFL